MDAFLAWMNGLDAVKVAETNSFHSQAHREEMRRHEADKRGRVVSESKFQHELNDIGQMWSQRDLKQLRQKTTLMRRIENNPIEKEVKL